MRSATPKHARYDAIVVGARCAGAATALLLAREGLRVLVVDRSRYGADTLSTHALMRGAVMHLERWGVLDTLMSEGTPLVSATTFHYAEERIRVDIAPRGGIPGLVAPRRNLLDRVLVDAAREAGAEVVYGVRLVNLCRPGGGRVDGVVIEDGEGHLRSLGAGIVIGADGMRSTVAELARARTYRKGRFSTGVVFGYFSGLGNDGYRWHYRPGVSVGVIPTNGDQSCVFASVPSRRFREEIRFDPSSGFGRILRECSPELADTLGQAQREGHFRGFPGQAGFFRQSYGRGWALVGDAGYFKDPLTAHGITDAFRDAEILTRAVVRGTIEALSAYQATRDRIASDLFEVTDEIASFEWDLPAVKDLHLRLSAEMKKEVVALQEWRDTVSVPVGRTA